MRVLVVDDEKKMREFICFFLNKESIETREASSGLEAVQLIKEEDFDLLIIDKMMPLMDGFEAVREIRQFSTIPIIMLTAVESESSHIEGYDLGIDDYITKPFKMSVLMAKIKRMMTKLDRGYSQYHELHIDRKAREVRVLQDTINLAPKEYELLEYMIINKNLAMSRNQILEEVWGYDFEGNTRVVDNHIKKLRSKLDPFSDRIKTVVGYGYKLEV